MKLIILSLIAACFLCLAPATSNAQQALTPVTVSAVNTVDTLNSGYVNTYYDYGTIQFNSLKVSGTPAGTCFLEGSIDGVGWFHVPGKYSDTITITNTTNTKGYSWTLDGVYFKYYRVIISYTGTQTSTPTGWIYLQRKRTISTIAN